MSRPAVPNTEPASERKCWCLILHKMPLCTGGPCINAKPVGAS